MTALHALLVCIAAAGSAMAAIFYRFYNPPQDEPITLNSSPMPVEPPVSPGTTPPAVVPPKVSIETFCGYIRDYEGKPGDLNYMLCNPLDCRPSPVGYLAKYQPVVIVDTDTDPAYPYHVGKFAKFKDWDTGWEYGVNMMHFMVLAHLDWNFYDLLSHFAPSSDRNDPNKYAESIAKDCGVVPTTVLSTIIG